MGDVQIKDEQVIEGLKISYSIEVLEDESRVSFVTIGQEIIEIKDERSARVIFGRLINLFRDKLKEKSTE